MSKRRRNSSKTIINNDQKIIKPSGYLKTQKEHKDWYDIREMGKQKNRPRLVPREKKKQKNM